MSVIGKTDYYKRDFLSIPGSLIKLSDIRNTRFPLPSSHGIIFMGDASATNAQVYNYPIVDQATGQWFPKEIISGTQFKKIASINGIPNMQGTITAGIDMSDKLWTWGSTAISNGAQMASVSATPRQVGSSDWLDVDVGGTSITAWGTIACRSDGTLWYGGIGSNGQSGNNNTTTNITAMTQVGTDTDWAQCFHAGTYVFAVKSNGTLYGWGSQTGYVLGNNVASGNQLTPVQIGSSTDWLGVRISSSGSSLAIKSNGTLWSCGSNASGVTGQGTTSGNTTTWTQVGTDTNWFKVFTNSSSTFLLKTNGDAYYCGFNGSGTTHLVGSNITSPTLLLDHTTYGYTFTDMCASGSRSAYFLGNDNSLHIYSSTQAFDYDGTVTVRYGHLVGKLPAGSKISMPWRYGLYVYY